MKHATSRAIRRSNTRRIRPITLQALSKDFEEKKIPCAVASGRPSLAGDYICIKAMRAGFRHRPEIIRTFAHPTKKTTLGRIVTIRSAV